MLTALVVIIVSDYTLQRYLDFLNASTWSNQVPVELNDLYDAEKYSKAMQYDKAKINFSLITDTFGTGLILVLLLTGILGKYNDWVISVTDSLIYQCFIFFGLMAVVNDIITMPFSLYNTFVIEEKFGFNKMTLTTFIADKLKGYLLGAIIGGCLLAMFIWFYQYAGETFWFYAWLVFSVFTLLITMFYSSVILPVFNKLTPLPAGELRSAIENYCRQVNFKLDNLFVMDGSKRSSKANAFFSGIGRKKRIVLFDTLLQQHATDELVAILAHEIGHYKKRHTQQAYLTSVLQTGFTLFIFSLFVNTSQISNAFGSENHSLMLSLLGFGILYSPISMAMGLVQNYVSRKNEYEADRFAKTTFSGTPLIAALKKLSVNHLSNLQPHPWYVIFHYSHPTLLQRIKALE